MISLVKCSYCLLMKYDFICLQFFLFFFFLFIPNANCPASYSDPSLLASTELYKDALINLFGAHWKFTSTWLLLGSIPQALLPPISSMGIFPRPHCLFHPMSTFPEQFILCQTWPLPPLGFTTCFWFTQLHLQDMSIRGIKPRQLTCSIEHRGVLSIRCWREDPPSI